MHVSHDHRRFNGYTDFELLQGWGPISSINQTHAKVLGLIHLSVGVMGLTNSLTLYNLDGTICVLGIAQVL